MTFNRQFSQGLGAILDYAVSGGTELTQTIYAVIVSDAWDPEDYLDTENMSAAEADVAAYLWDGTTDGGGNALATPVTVTVSSVTVTASTLTITIGDVAFGNCSDEGDSTAYESPGWIVFFIEEATVATDADRYIIGVADFPFTPVDGDSFTWLADDAGTFVYKF